MRCILSGLLVVALGLPIANAAELAYRIPVGMTYAFRETSTNDSVLTITGAGEQGDVAQQTKTTLAGRVEVVATADGRPTLARVSFSPESAMVITVNGT
ncbi:MAG: hypothetical protein AAGC71_12555, partial [Pseudomonadota bacterium]